MGFSLAEAGINLANVTLITGPSLMKSNDPNINLINVASGEEMYNENLKFF